MLDFIKQLVHKNKPCPYCGDTGWRWLILPDDVGSPNLIPCTCKVAPKIEITNNGNTSHIYLK